MVSIPEKGELFLATAPEDLSDIYINIVRLGYERNGQEAPDIAPGTYIHNIGTALGNVGLLAFANVDLNTQNADVLTATGDALDAIRDARGLPELLPSGSTGKVIVTILGGGTANFADGDELILPNGLRLEVAGTQTDIVDQGTINVSAIDTGTATNVDAGTVVRFADAPLNVQTNATVDLNGLTGGLDNETDDEKRNRILNRLRNIPGGGNPAQLRDIANNASAAVQDAFIFPSIGGAGSCAVALTGALVWTGSGAQSFTREVSATTIDLVHTAIQDEINTAFEIVVQSVEDEPVDIAVSLNLPNDGSGWVNGSSAFPKLVGADNGRVTVTNVTNNTQFRISANTTTAPVDNITKVSWWSPLTRKFYSAKVIGHSGSAGAWNLTVDTALNDGVNDIAVGDFVSPSAANEAAYRDTFLESMNELGPSEKTTITATDLTNRRRYRQPTVDEEFPTDITTLQLSDLFAAHGEIRNAEYGYRSLTTPTVPTTLSASPRILALQSFALYPI